MEGVLGSAWMMEMFCLTVDVSWPSLSKLKYTKGGYILLHENVYLKFFDVEKERMGR